MCQSWVRDLTVVWSDDGARAYILPSGPGVLDAGMYVIQLSYHQDIGLESPLLRRSGSTLPEIVGLSFELL